MLVVVTVLDINDNTPTFLANSYSGFVVENSNVGNTILAVEAKDLDAVSIGELSSSSSLSLSSS